MSPFASKKPPAIVASKRPRSVELDPGLVAHSGHCLPGRPAACQPSVSDTIAATIFLGTAHRRQRPYRSDDGLRTDGLRSRGVGLDVLSHKLLELIHAVATADGDHGVSPRHCMRGRWGPFRRPWVIAAMRPSSPIQSLPLKLDDSLGATLVSRVSGTIRPAMTRLMVFPAGPDGACSHRRVAGRRRWTSAGRTRREICGWRGAPSHEGRLHRASGGTSSHGPGRRGDMRWAVNSGARCQGA